jgi:CDP-glycerol glycerophosphotransferase
MFKQVLIKVITVLNHLIPKSKYKILLYSFPDFSDNSWALYNYLMKNNDKKYKYYWFVTDPKKFRLRKVKNTYFYNSYGSFSLLSKLYYTLTSKYIFTTHLWLPISPSMNQNIIYLWHGSPLKKIAKKDIRNSNKSLNYFSYIMGFSDIYVPIMKESFECNIDQILLNGSMRNDLLFEDSIVLEKLGFHNNYKKFIIYMPTFRKIEGSSNKDGSVLDNNETGLQMFSTKKSLTEFNNYLVKNNILFVIKLHPSEDLTCIELQNHSHINFLLNSNIEEKEVQLYHLLSKADALISDYSSVYLDYLVLDRPIGFVIDDYESYSNTRGFLFEDVISMMPGSIINNKDQLFKFVDNLINDIDEFHIARKSVKTLVNKYPDNRNRERLINFLKM